MSDTPLPEEPAVEPVLAVDGQSHPTEWSMLLRLEEVRSAIDLLAEEARALTMALEAMVPRVATYTDMAGVPWRATVVRPDDTVLVNLGVVQALDPQLYEQITVTALNRKALNKALRAGQVKREVAQAAMATRPNSPSIRLVRLDEPEPTLQEDDE